MLCLTYPHTDSCDPLARVVLTVKVDVLSFNSPIKLLSERMLSFLITRLGSVPHHVLTPIPYHSSEFHLSLSLFLQSGLYSIPGVG